KVDGSEPHFRPLMAKSEVDIPAVQQLLGRGVSSTIEWEPSYTNKLGTSIGNPAQVFARVTNTPPLNFDTDKSGGLVAPNIGVSGLSRSLGPVGGPVDLLVNGAEGSFDPEKIFGEVKLLGGIKFVGILEFVNKLQSFIPSDGFKDPPSIELLGPPDPGVNVGFSLGLPTIGVGVMTMQNVSLSALFYLPFGAKPMNFRFAFCERQQPFILTVSLFGGGGFFAIKIGLDGVEDLEASLEFGASIALNLGV